MPYAPGHSGMVPDETTERIPEARSTAPQSPFTRGQVAAGFVVLVVGLLIVVGVPLMGTL